MKNRTIFQFFHWYYSAEGNLWNHCSEHSANLAVLGVTDVWLPPAWKSAQGKNEPGYAVYDMYDLGEFDQKGFVRTKHGTKEEYLRCIRRLHDQQISVLADVVLNHKTGGDELEKFPVVWVNSENRKEATSGEEVFEAPTRFKFPGRNKKYSNYIWDWHSFTGVSNGNRIGLIRNEYTRDGWEELPVDQKGNFDYLLGNDVEFRNPFVRQEILNWGKWYVETTGVDGFRLDGLKHMNPAFLPEWIDELNNHFNRNFFVIGEYWKEDLDALLTYLQITLRKIQLFDVPLHFAFHRASKKGEGFDMRSLFERTLISRDPERTITFVGNHDTQPLQALESVVEHWFKPHAYANILLREQGIPCVFYPDLFSAEYSDRKDGKDIYIKMEKVRELPLLMQVRSHFAYGRQKDYFDHAHVVGFTREGVPEHPHSGCAVLMSNSAGGEKKMSLGEANRGRKLVDITGNFPDELRLDDKGETVFKTKGGAVSVWIDIEGKHMLNKQE